MAEGGGLQIVKGRNSFRGFGIPPSPPFLFLRFHLFRVFFTRVLIGLAMHISCVRLVNI